jgi:hypothetical protein
MTSELAAIMVFFFWIACPYFTGGGTGRILFYFLVFSTSGQN